LVGDKLVIATTDFYGKHSEEVEITDLSDTIIYFTPALKWKHLGVTESFNGH